MGFAESGRRLERLAEKAYFVGLNGFAMVIVPDPMRIFGAGEERGEEAGEEAGEEGK